MNAHINTHGDGVKDVAFLVENAQAVYEYAISQGAKSVQEPQTLADEHGEVIIAKLQTYGDTVHSLIQNKTYKGPFLPGYMPCQPDPINQNFKQPPFVRIDHIVGNQPVDQMHPAAEWYFKHLLFHKYWSVDENQIHTEFSALRSVVVADFDEVIKMPINEPAEIKGGRKSQIQEYVEFYGGSGVQHIAFETQDILASVGCMKARGLDFLLPPKSYYENLQKRLANATIKVTEDMNKIAELGILVDFDDKGYLLQIFTKPVADRPTLFFEVIQRKNNNGFGIGNFKALFEALEQEQEKRGNL